MLEAEITMIPQTMTEVKDATIIAGMENLLDMLEDDDDVQNVWHNWEEE